MFKKHWLVEINLRSGFFLPFLFGRRGGKDAWYLYFTRRLPVLQHLDFCLIGHKTKDPSEPCTDWSSNISDFRSY